MHTRYVYVCLLEAGREIVWAKPRRSTADTAKARQNSLRPSLGRRCQNSHLTLTCAWRDFCCCFPPTSFLFGTQRLHFNGPHTRTPIRHHSDQGRRSHQYVDFFPKESRRGAVRAEQHASSRRNTQVDDEPVLRVLERGRGALTGRFPVSLRPTLPGSSGGRAHNMGLWCHAGGVERTKTAAA